MNANTDTYGLPTVDRDLIDLLSAALDDPALHDDIRARLRHEIGRLLQIAYDDLYGEAGAVTHERAMAAGPHELPAALELVLVDPNLHTDMRARIYQSISDLLAQTRPDAD
jgi:hypothetical protein